MILCQIYIDGDSLIHCCGEYKQWWMSEQCWISDLCWLNGLWWKITKVNWLLWMSEMWICINSIEWMNRGECINRGGWVNAGDWVNRSEWVNGGEDETPYLLTGGDHPTLQVAQNALDQWHPSVQLLDLKPKWKWTENETGGRRTQKTEARPSLSPLEVNTVFFCTRWLREPLRETMMDSLCRGTCCSST